MFHHSTTCKNCQDDRLTGPGICFSINPHRGITNDMSVGPSIVPVRVDKKEAEMNMQDFGGAILQCCIHQAYHSYECVSSCTQLEVTVEGWSYRVWRIGTSTWRKPTKMNNQTAAGGLVESKLVIHIGLLDLQSNSCDCQILFVWNSRIGSSKMPIASSLWQGRLDVPVFHFAVWESLAQQ